MCKAIILILTLIFVGLYSYSQEPKEISITDKRDTLGILKIAYKTSIVDNEKVSVIFQFAAVMNELNKSKQLLIKNLLLDSKNINKQKILLSKGKIYEEIDKYIIDKPVPLMTLSFDNVEIIGSFGRHTLITLRNVDVKIDVPVANKVKTEQIKVEDNVKKNVENCDAYKSKVDSFQNISTFKAKLISGRQNQILSYQNSKEDNSISLKDIKSKAEEDAKEIEKLKSAIDNFKVKECKSVVDRLAAIKGECSASETALTKQVSDISKILDEMEMSKINLSAEVRKKVNAHRAVLDGDVMKIQSLNIKLENLNDELKNIINTKTGSEKISSSAIEDQKRKFEQFKTELDSLRKIHSNNDSEAGKEMNQYKELKGLKENLNNKFEDISKKCSEECTAIETNIKELTGESTGGIPYWILLIFGGVITIGITAVFYLKSKTKTPSPSTAKTEGIEITDIREASNTNLKREPSTEADDDEDATDETDGITLIEFETENISETDLDIEPESESDLNLEIDDEDLSIDEDDLKK